MKLSFPKYACIFLILLNSTVMAQKVVKSDALFSNQAPLKIKLSYSNNSLNDKTNDSTYITSKLMFLEQNKFKEIEVKLRARGNFRRKNCFFTPVKIKIKNTSSDGTPFSGNSSLKLVLPCKNEKDKNDNIIKEFIAYKIYEIISPYYFKTRRLEIEYNDQAKKDKKKYSLKGFLIEDDDKVADRFEGKIVKRKIHPLAMDNFNSVCLSLFNYMIGNTDFSSSNQHNGKLLFSQKKIIPIPYDFDLTGWVSPSYGKGIINRLGYVIEKRNYIGYKRDEVVLYKVRDHFLTLKEVIFEKANSFKIDFDNPHEFNSMINYLKDFYRILENDKLFNRFVVSEARE